MDDQVIKGCDQCLQTPKVKTIDPYADFCGALARVFSGRGLSKLLSLRSSAGLGDGELLFGKRLWKYPKSDPYWGRLSSRWFSYEPEVANALAALLPFSDIFFDVGANIGFWSKFAAQKSDLRVVAIEPNPFLLDYLNDNLTSEQNCEILDSAIASVKSEYVILNCGELGGNHAGSSITDTGREGRLQKRVPVMTMDSLIQQRLDSAGFAVVKLDIEGAEEAVISTSNSISNPNIAWIYEDHGSDLNHSSTRAFLDRGEHTIHFLGSKQVSRLVITEVSQLSNLKKKSHYGYNLLAIPSAKRDHWEACFNRKA